MTGVNTQHKEYMEYADIWAEMRDHLKGSRAIKEKGTAYLPMLGNPKDQQDVINYQGYLARALYYEATKRTREAMVGAILMKPPTYTNLDEKYLENFKQVTLDGYSMDTFVRNVITELVSVSRTGVLVERAKAENGGAMYFVQYKAEDIINWRFERVQDKIVLTLVVLMETYNSAVDKYDSTEKTRYRVLELIDGVYVQSVVEGTIGDDKKVSYNTTETVVPMNVGKPLPYIPFVFFTPMGNVPTVCTPLLDSIAGINLSHYRTSADLEHGRHFTALPTAWIAGFDTDKEFKLGSQIAWVTDIVGASAGFLEFTGQGLRALEVALAEKAEQMATMGARMLRPPRDGVEAAETARIYQSAESGTLGSLALSAGESATMLLRFWLEWQGADAGDVSVEFNTDYVDTRLDSAAMSSLLQLYLSGVISYDTLFYNLKNGEIMPDGSTAEEERDKIDAAGPINAEGGIEPQ